MFIRLKNGMLRELNKKHVKNVLIITAYFEIKLQSNFKRNMILRKT
jgi:hypothetical protein